MIAEIKDDAVHLQVIRWALPEVQLAIHRVVQLEEALTVIIVVVAGAGAQSFKTEVHQCEVVVEAAEGGVDLVVAGERWVMDHLTQW